MRAFRRTHRHLYRSSKQGVLRIIAKRHRLSKRVALWDITYDHVCRAKLTQEDLEEYQWLILRALSALSAEIGISFTAGVPGPMARPVSFGFFVLAESRGKQTTANLLPARLQCPFS